MPLTFNKASRRGVEPAQSRHSVFTPLRFCFVSSFLYRFNPPSGRTVFFLFGLLCALLPSPFIAPPPPTFFSCFISLSSAEIRLASYSCVYFKQAKRSFRVSFSFAPVPYRSSSRYFFFYYFFVSNTPVLLTENGTGVLFRENKDIAAQLSFGT